MLTQIFVGSGTSLVNFVIHAMLLAGVVRAVHVLSLGDAAAPQFLQHSLIIVATGALLVAGHFLEVVLWAGTYALVHAAPPGTHLVYFAFVNYTTLGYGDDLPNNEWRLLAPLTALNGVLLIGWSTALMFEVLRRTGPASPGR